MKKVILLLASFILGIIAFSQEITVRFTGQLNETDYCRVDSVVITNLTRDWSETVEYPDTIIVLGSTVEANLNISAEQGLGQNIPNPFDCETLVELIMSQNENVRMQLLDVAGRVYAEYYSSLDAGIHIFEISATNPQIYLLNATVGNRQYSIRMVNVGNVCGCSINYAGKSNGIEAKLASTNEFRTGDNMSYVGYATIEGELVESSVVEQSQVVNQYITLDFTYYFVPSIETLDATEITATTATLNAIITDDGGADVTARGFYYGLSPENLAYQVVSDVTTDDFSAIVTPLDANTTYYYKAYATNSAGTSIGNTETFTTLNCSDSHGTDTQTACDSYEWIDGITYTESTMEPTFTLTNIDGCDSIVSLHLTIYHSNMGIDEQIACDSYTWINGVTYIESTDEPTFTLTNISGCDSIVTLHLTINHSNTGIDEQIACDSYTWINGITYTESTNEPTFTLNNISGCDSVVTLYLTITHSNTGVDNQIACDSYTWINGITYMESTNEPTYTLINAEGCDSVVNLHLTMGCPPTVFTYEATEITTISATIKGSVTSNGGATVTARGFIYGTNANSLTQYVQTGGSTSYFTTTITGLTYGTTYFYRACATNSFGTAYGEILSFTTQGAFTDIRDGNVYAIVEIGNQIWMAENLRYEGGIPLGGNSPSTSTAYLYYPNDNENNVSNYGYLYNWKAVMNGEDSSSSNPSGVQGICPNGWHLPSRAEWSQLINFLGSHSEYQCGSVSSHTAKALASTTGWTNYTDDNCAIGCNQSRNNSTGFNALPASYCNYDGNHLFYYDLGGRTYFWSTTEEDTLYFSGRYVLCMILSFSSTYIDIGGIDKTWGASVRCVRDE